MPAGADNCAQADNDISAMIRGRAACPAPSSSDEGPRLQGHEDGQPLVVHSEDVQRQCASAVAPSTELARTNRASDHVFATLANYGSVDAFGPGLCGGDIG